MNTADPTKGTLHGVRGRHASRDDARAGLGDGATLRRGRLLGQSPRPAGVRVHDQGEDRKPGPRAALRHPGRARSRRVRLDRQHDRGEAGGDQRQQGVRERTRRQRRAARRDRLQLDGAHRPLEPGQVYNNVTSQFATGPFANYINNSYSPNGWTNWEDAFAEVSTLSTRPELVVFLTDGDPTARFTTANPETGFPNGSYLTMDPAFTRANALKASGLHMFAIGVGAALSNNDSRVRLRAISGPHAFPDSRCWRPTTRRSPTSRNWRRRSPRSDVRSARCASG